MKGKYVLVTGGTGFIGSHLVKALLEQGANIAVLTRDQDRAVVPDGVALVEGDIRYGIEVAPYNVVFHLGAYHHVGRSWDHAEECYDTNAKGTGHVARQCWREDTKLIYMSTSEVYGGQNSVPWAETLQPNPQSPYAISKYAGELHCKAYQEMGAQVSIVRAFNVYGPGQSRGALIGELIRTALKNEDVHTTEGKQTREFVYVDDIVRGLILAAQRNFKGPVNLCTGKDLSIYEVTEIVMQEVGGTSKLITDVPYRPNEIWKMRGSNQRAGEVLEWTPEIDFAEGIKKTVGWFRGKV